MAEAFKGELPPPLRFLLKPAAFLPLGPFLTLGIQRFARRRPEVFERLGSYRTSTYLVEPSDLDFGFLIRPDGASATIRTQSKSRAPDSDVQVRGPLLVLLGLLDGTFDGDALFFNRAIAVSGRTDALVALRNAIEDAELKPSDFIGLSGNPGRLVDKAVTRALADLRRLSGATLTGDAP